MMRIKFFFPVLFVLGLMGWLYTMLGAQKPHSSMRTILKTGDSIPGISFQTASGDNFLPENFKEHPTLVLFTASWCPFCKIGYATVQDALSIAPVRTVGVIYKDAHIKPDILLEYKKAFDILLVDPDIRSSLKWGIQGLPSMIVVNKQGRVVWSGTGQVSKETLIKAFETANNGS